MWGTSCWARQVSAWAWWLCLQVLAVKHTWTIKTNTNFSRQPLVPTTDTHLRSFLLLPPQDICWNCTGSDQTPLPNTCRYLRVKEGANALIPPQVYFLSRQLGGNYFFLFFMPNSPTFDSVFSCHSTCLVLEPCKSLSFKALCGLSADWGRGTISSDLDQTAWSCLCQAEEFKSF